MGGRLLDLFEEVGDSLLFVFVFVIVLILIQPIWDCKSRDRVLNLLQNSRNNKHFLDGVTNSFNVVIPINNGSHISVFKVILFEPFLELSGLYGFITVKNGNWDGSLTDWDADRLLSNNEKTIQTLALDDFFTQEFSHSLGSCQSNTFSVVIFFNSF